jgi:uncharacterized protein YidB (DUF937 family)
VEFKVRLVRAALREDKALAELAGEHPEIVDHLANKDGRVPRRHGEEPSARPVPTSFRSAKVYRV